MNVGKIYQVNNRKYSKTKNIAFGIKNIGSTKIQDLLTNEYKDASFVLFDTTNRTDKNLLDEVKQSWLKFDSEHIRTLVDKSKEVIGIILEGDTALIDRILVLASIKPKNQKDQTYLFIPQIQASPSAKAFNSFLGTFNEKRRYSGAGEKLLAKIAELSGDRGKAGIMFEAQNEGFYAKIGLSPSQTSQYSVFNYNQLEPLINKNKEY